MRDLCRRNRLQRRWRNRRLKVWRGRDPPGFPSSRRPSPCPSRPSRPSLVAEARPRPARNQERASWQSRWCCSCLVTTRTPSFLLSFLLALLFVNFPFSALQHWSDGFVAVLMELATAKSKADASETQRRMSSEGGGVEPRLFCDLWEKPILAEVLAGTGIGTDY